MVRCRVLLALAGWPLVALDPSLSISQYHKQIWQVEQGLPQNFVNDIIQDETGRIVVATEGGVARFDGLAFAPFSTDPAVRWPRQWITTLLQEGKSTLWVGSRRTGVYRIENGSSRQFRPEKEFSIYDLFLDRDGGIWVFTTTGVWTGRAGRFRRLEFLKEVEGYVWSVAAQTLDGSVWTITRDGLTRIRGTSFERIQLPESAGEPLAVYQGRSDRLWLGTATGAFVLERGQEIRFRKLEGTRGRVSSILEDRDGNVWLGTWGSGLTRVNASGVAHWSADDGLPDDFVRCLFEDSEGNLWIGTRSGGISRWKSTAIIPYGPSEGLGGNFASAVVAAPQGGLYLGTWRSGLGYTGGQSVRQVPPPMPAQHFLVRSMAVDRQGTLWVGSWQGFFYGDRRGLKKAGGDPEAQRYSSALLFDERGALWMGSDRLGLLEYPDGRPNPQNRRLWLSGETITTLARTTDGAVLAGTSSGVVRIASGKIHYLLGGPGTDDPITALHQDTRGRVWAGLSGNSIAVIEAGKVRQFRPEHGFPPVPVMAIAEDRVGNLWMSSAHGLYRIPMAEIERLFAGTIPRVDPIRYGQDDGMRSSECHGKSQPAVVLDSAGALWFPTVRGFVRVLPERLQNDRPPEPWLGAVRVGGELKHSGDAISVPSGIGPVEVDYTAVSLTAPEQLEFRYRLTGYDQDWHYAGRARTATYTRLPGGSYSFEVSVRRAGGEWSRAVPVTRIHQAAEFRETAWFALLIAALGGASVGVIVLVHQRLRRARIRAVQSERDRIAREWHDTLLADFAAVSWQLEATREKIPDHQAAARSSLDLAHAMVRHSQTEARRLIHDLRESEQDGSASLCEALKKALRRLNAEHAVQTVVEVKGSEPPVALRHRRDILMICQEAVANALRHSRASRVGVIFDYSRSGLKVTVQDDGVGVQSSEPAPGHFGLRGMHERARNLGAQLAIKSEPGLGTTVTLSIPAEILD